MIQDVKISELPQTCTGIVCAEYKKGHRAVDQEQTFQDFLQKNENEKHTIPIPCRPHLRTKPVSLIRNR